ncbi:MAG: branched-chain amino acid ABC transporter substrate-binding protein [Acidimicrobiia bacterium]|nr:branched-chain amino acid ABC transporter substrate-binding protein [Acidimicrobiia bacterium]
MKARACLGALAAIIIVSAAGACSDTSPPSLEGEVTLAVALPLSGEYAAFGQTIADGVELAAENLNAAGGLLGQEVVVEVFDDRADSRNAAVLAEEVVASGAKAVIGHYNSGVSIAAAPVYAGRVLQITPTSTRPDLTALGIDTVFRVAPTDAAQGPTIAQRIIADGHSRPAFVYDADSVYASGLVDYTVAALQSEGIEPVAVEPFGAETRDWAVQLTSAAAAEPDALVVVTSAPRAAQVVRQARELGLDVSVYGGDSLAKEEFLLKAGQSAEGATITALLPDVVTGSGEDAGFVSQYREDFGRNPGRDAPAGVAAAEVWFAGVEAAGTTDPEAVARALKEESFVYESPIGTIAFDANGDLRDQKLWVNVVQDSRFVQVS